MGAAQTNTFNILPTNTRRAVWLFETFSLVLTRLKFHYKRFCREETGKGLENS